MKSNLKLLPLLAVCLAAPCTQADVPGILSHQGKITVGGTNFTGDGLFKFALVNAAGGATYWSHSGTSTGGSEPTGSAVTLPVTRGVFSVNLGDTSVANMTQTIPASVFANSEVYLRVWFNDGVNGLQQLTPDRRMTSVGYALAAGSFAASNLTVAGTVTGLEFVASATNLWEDLQFPAQALNPAGSAGSAVLSTTWGPSANMPSILFAKDVTQCVFVNAQLPHSYVPDTSIHPHLHVSPRTTTAGNVVFVMRYTWANLGQFFAAETVVTNVMTITSGDQWKHRLFNLGTNGIAPSATMGGASSVLSLRLERQGGNPLDTYNGDIDVLGFDIHYRARGTPVQYNP